MLCFVLAIVKLPGINQILLRLDFTSLRAVQGSCLSVANWPTLLRQYTSETCTWWPKDYKVFLLCLVRMWTVPSSLWASRIVCLVLGAVLSLALVGGFVSFRTGHFSAKDSRYPSVALHSVFPFLHWCFAPQVPGALAFLNYSFLCSTARLLGLAQVPQYSCTGVCKLPTGIE